MNSQRKRTLKSMPDATAEKTRTTRYPDIVDHLRREIQQLNAKPGSRLASFVELQNRFGTTPNTVNRALSELAREGLIERARGRGIFVADRSARTSPLTVGFISSYRSEQASTYWTHLVAGMAHGAETSEIGLRVVFGFEPSDVKMIDGILLHAGNDVDNANKHLPPGFPRVLMMTQSENVPSVVVDDYDAGWQATRHLTDLGHRRIACMMYPGSMAGLRRIAGYLAALRQAGIEAEDTWIHYLGEGVGPNSHAVHNGLWLLGRETMRAWLATRWSKDRFTALVVQNDLFAIGVLDALRDGGLSVPDDVSLVSFDSLEECERVKPRLTSVAIPVERVGEAAVDLLARRLRGEADVETFLMLPTEICVRDSTAASKA